MDAFQRTLVHRWLQVPQRAREDLRDFLRRHERISSRVIAHISRADWGRLQRYRVFTFAGHMARLQTPSHAAATVLQWRDDRSWAAYRDKLPPRTGGQPGRRAPRMFVPGAVEQPFREALDLGRTAPEARHIWRTIRQEMRSTPQDWREVAQNRAVWRAFSRWCCFEREL